MSSNPKVKFPRRIFPAKHFLGVNPYMMKFNSSLDDCKGFVTNGRKGLKRWKRKRERFKKTKLLHIRLNHQWFIVNNKYDCIEVFRHQTSPESDEEMSFSRWGSRWGKESGRKKKNISGWRAKYQFRIVTCLVATFPESTSRRSPTISNTNEHIRSIHGKCLGRRCVWESTNIYIHRLSMRQ